MGYFTEINTLLKLPSDFNTTQLKVGQTFTVTKDKERVFPLHTAMLLVGDDWSFYGYCVVHSAELKDKRTTLDFEVLSLFTDSEKAIYKTRFLAAAKLTSEV